MPSWDWKCVTQRSVYLCEGTLPAIFTDMVRTPRIHSAFSVLHVSSLWSPCKALRLAYLEIFIMHMKKKQHTGDWAHRLWFEPGNWDTTVFLDIRAERAFKLPSGSPRRDFSDKASVKFRWMCRKGTKARAAPCPKTSIHKNLIATLGGHSHVTRNQRKALGHETSLCWAERGR